MLLIKDAADLKKYLETRLRMAKLQAQDEVTKGMRYAFEESIKAVDALLQYRDMPEYRLTTANGKQMLYAENSPQQAIKLAHNDGYRIVKVEIRSSYDPTKFIEISGVISESAERR